MREFQFFESIIEKIIFINYRFLQVSNNNQIHKGVFMECLQRRLYLTKQIYPNLVRVISRHVL
jgi:hypothetical protein